jgi:hypothetical protein
MSAKLFLVGGAALAGLYLLETDCSGNPLSGRKAGPACTAAALQLRTRQSWFGVPENGSMVCAWHSMKKAIGSRALTRDELVAICDLWLAAYNAGCSASKTNAVTDSLYEATAVNWSTVKLPLPSQCAPSSATQAPCKADWAAARTPMGNAVCSLLAERSALTSSSPWGDDEAPADTVLARTRKLAEVMDTGDFRRDGEREFDKLPRVADLPGKVLGAIPDFINTLGMTTIIVLAGGFVVWRLVR